MADFQPVHGELPVHAEIGAVIRKSDRAAQEAACGGDVGDVEPQCMFAEVAFDVQSAGGSCGEVGAGTVDAIDLLLEAGDVAGRRIVQIQVVDVFQGIEHVASIDDLTAALKTDIEFLAHRHAGRIPIGGEGVGCRGHSGSAHAHLARSDKHKFHCRRLKRQEDGQT